MTSHLRQHYPEMQAIAHQLSRDERKDAALARKKSNTSAAFPVPARTGKAA